MVDEAKDLGKEILKDAKEVIIERFFSPMYFYFIMAWILCNWTFIYSLLFVGSEKFKKFKLDYLLSFYPTNNFWDYADNFCHVLLFPALSTYILIWWISRLSEFVFEKFETYKSNKLVIKRRVEYKQVRDIETEKRKAHDTSDDKKIDYDENEEFNESFDENEEFITISGITYSPSRVLYNIDYKSYIEHINDSKEREKINNTTEESKQK